VIQKIEHTLPAHLLLFTIDNYTRRYTKKLKDYQTPEKRPDYQTPKKLKDYQTPEKRPDYQTTKKLKDYQTPETYRTYRLLPTPGTYRLLKQPCLGLRNLDNARNL
jgi:hypothetical protein